MNDVSDFDVVKRYAIGIACVLNTKCSNVDYKIEYFLRAYHVTFYVNGTSTTFTGYYTDIKRTLKSLLDLLIKMGDNYNDN